jgi:type IX secretion system PorP/SprF family membrane protein
MHLKKIILLVFFTAYSCYAIAQQDAQYSQYMFNQLALNPAYAGSRDVLSTTILYRNQWTGIAGAPTTGSLSLQMPFKKKKIGMGAEIISDKIGPKNVSALLFSYAYKIPLPKGQLSLGLRMGLYNFSFDWNKIDYKDKSDLYNTGGRSSKTTGTGDFGLYYFTHSFYWGVGINHLNRGKIIDSQSNIGKDGTITSRQAIHFFMPIGKSFQIGNIVLNPIILFKKASNSPGTVDLSVNVLLKEILWLGVSVRSKYGIVILSQYKINDKLKIGYSFDYGVNKIGIAGKGTHEIMLGYDLGFQETKIITPRYL